MSSRRFRIAILLAAILVAATVLASQTRTDFPPSVPPDQWVGLNDRAGIEITGKSSKGAGRPGEIKGQLWVKVDGTWSPILIEQPRNLVPAS